MSGRHQEWCLLDELSYEDLEDAPEFGGDPFEAFQQVDEGGIDDAFIDLDSVGNRYACSLLELHFYFWVFSGRGYRDRDEWRAVYKRSEVGRSKVAYWGDVTTSDDIPSDGPERGNACNEHAVFVFVAQHTQDREGLLEGESGKAVAKCRIHSVVGLESLHHCDVAIGRSGEPRRAVAIGPIEGTKNDRELSSASRRAVVRLNELPREVVEGGPGVVDEIANEQSPLARQFLEKSEVEDVLLRRSRVV